MKTYRVQERKRPYHIERADTEQGRERAARLVWIGRCVLISDGPDRGTALVVRDVEPHPTHGWSLPILVGASLNIPSNMVARLGGKP